MDRAILPVYCYNYTRKSFKADHQSWPGWPLKSKSHALLNRKR